MTDLHLLSGTELPDLLTGDWVGPLIFRGCGVHPGGCPCVLVEGDLSDDPEPLSRVLCLAEASDHGGTSDVPTRLLSLDLLRPECLARVGEVMARGLRCPSCAGVGAHGPRGMWDLDSQCGMCSGTSWTRKPSPLWHLLDAARTQALSPLVIAQAVGWSVRSVARGGGVLSGVVRPWFDTIDESWSRSEVCGAAVSMAVWQTQRSAGYGWRFLPHDREDLERYGPETGAEGREAADRAARLAFFATLNNGVATFPELPHG